jgi:hypothetical protein
MEICGGPTSTLNGIVWWLLGYGVGEPSLSIAGIASYASTAHGTALSCHCEERSDAAISIAVRNGMGIAALRSR